MAGLQEEELLELPLEDIKQSCGFGLDIGGSIAKLVYRSNKDYKNGEPISQFPKEGHGYIRIKGFPRDKLDGVLDFISENCDVTKEDDGLVHVHTTGIGGNQFQKKIEEKFGSNFRIKNEVEFDLFVRTFHKLAASLGKEQILLPESKEGVREGMTLVGHFRGIREGIREHSKGHLVKDQPNGKLTNEQTDDDAVADNLFPCLLVMCGSGNAIFKVHEDGTFQFADGVVPGGRMFLGLGNFLTGVKDFDELMEMVSKADGGTTNIFARHLKSKDSQDMYSAFADDHMVYAFGQGTTHSRDEVKKEDLVHSLLELTVSEIVHIVHLNANLLGINKAFFCGNFVNHEIPRKTITARFTLRNTLKIRNPCDFGFVKHGGFLGAIGAYLAGSETKVKKQ